MSTTGQRRTRAQRVAAHVAYEGMIDRIYHIIVTDNGFMKLWLVFGASMIFCVIIRAWNPSFTYQINKPVERDIVCRSPFTVLSQQKTDEAQNMARYDTPHVYVNDPSRITQMKVSLTNMIQTLLSYDTYDSMPLDKREEWKKFLPLETTDETLASTFADFHLFFENDSDLLSFKSSLDRVFLPLEKNGVLRNLHNPRDGNQEKISVYSVNESQNQAKEVLSRDVLLGNAIQIKEQLANVFNRDIAELLFHWIRPAIPDSLTEDEKATRKRQNEAEEFVQPVYVTYEPGQVLVKAGQVLDPKTFSFFLLREEYKSVLAHRTFLEKMLRFLAFFTLIFLMLIQATFLIQNYLCHHKNVRSFRIFLIVFGLMIGTVLVSRILQTVLLSRGTNILLVPLCMFVEIVTIAFCAEISSITSFIVAFIILISGTADLGTFVMATGICFLIAVMSRDIRTRIQLITIGVISGIVVFILSCAIGFLTDQTGFKQIFSESILRMLWVMLAGFLVSGFLSFIEQIFGLLTPMRLLEIGNPSHPLLQELSRRAPATYNHSMQTAAIAEAAAEAIGARSALIRVGAYFHDIGKMLKPDHFTENQSGFNIHNTLEPRVSTLVIVAHVKDGVDLAKQYHLPQPIIDLIEQHHGTMLVSFFYQKANQMNRDDTHGHKLDESSFRYPGPTPQSKEAGILMLADAAESACRSLGDVTPGRIENMVRQISEARMEDGQFDDSGLTLGEIRTVENSIITSILASRHSRIKYPGKEGFQNAQTPNHSSGQNGSVAKNGQASQNSQTSQNVQASQNSQASQNGQALQNSSVK